MDKLSQSRAPPNIKFRLLSPETFDETIVLMKTHFFPREPISICLKALQARTNPNVDELICQQEETHWLVNIMRYCPTTIIAQDSKNNDKVVGVVIADIAKKYSNHGVIEEWYDTQISNEELIQRWSDKNIEIMGNIKDKCIFQG